MALDPQRVQELKSAKIEITRENEQSGIEEGEHFIYPPEGLSTNNNVECPTAFS